MKISPMEIREEKLGRGLRGYEVADVERLRERAADALAMATREAADLSEEVGRLKKEIAEHKEREGLLRKSITTVQLVSEDIKKSSEKEAELLMAEASMRANEIIRQAHVRVTEIQQEINQYKRQRMELESSIRGILEYHGNILELGEDEARKADEELNKLKIFPK